MNVKTMRHISKNNMPSEFRRMPVVIYGGQTGRVIADLLVSEGIVVGNVIDDNEDIQGTYIKNTEVISYSAFQKHYRECEMVAVILTTIYGKTILKKMEELSNIQVYELYEWYSELIGKGNAQSIFDNQDLQEMQRQMERMEDDWADEESRHVLERLTEYLKVGDLSIIQEICTEEEQYFIPEVKKAIRFRLRIIDAGAYRGELLQVLKNNHFDFEKWYCFEPDQENYAVLLDHAVKNQLEKKQVCIRKGLWSASGRLFFEEGGTAGRIVPYETDGVIDVVSIDDYMGDEKCNFIKMDIEGAEFPALLGGINLIKRERPILAISIYHLLEDFWRIPQYLMQELDGYRYYVRHHSLIFSETVLYGIPEEL